MKEITKKKISRALKGNKNQEKVRSEETRRKISETRKRLFKERGWLNTLETRKKIGKAGLGRTAWNKGKKFSEESRKKMSLSALKRYENPENHYNWKGGKSFEPYTIEFNRRLKKKIKERDNFTCQLCLVKEKDYYQKLSIHHIDFNKNNCVDENLVTLCRSCNSKVNYKRDYWQNYFKEKVQRL
jgi:Ni/Co efflux regulator RcnB